MADHASFDPFDLNKQAFEKKDDTATRLTEENGQGPLQASLQEADSFDPFGIAATALSDSGQQEDALSTSSPDPPPQVSRITRSKLALPPKLVVKLTVYEEVSSTAKIGSGVEGASEVSLEGNVYAQVQCSDAKKNAPFGIVAIQRGTSLALRPNSKFTTVSPSNLPIVNIPKHEIGYVPIAYYSVNEQVEHMPILLERKVTTHGESCRVAVQIRSKLTNRGDMEDFTVAVAVPERVDGESIQILRGEGEWDELQRIIKWKLPLLNRGESFMVSAQAKLWKTKKPNEDIRFPVLLRCSSTADQISSVEIQSAEAEGHPSSLTSTTTYSFRLLHRLT